MLIVLLFGPEASEGFTGNVERELDWVLVFLVLVFAPLVESLIVWVSVWLLGYGLRFEWHLTAALAGLIHVPLHGLSTLSWSVLPTFALQAFIVDQWIGKGRPAAGYWIIAASHALQNAIALLFRLVFP